MRKLMFFVLFCSSVALPSEVRPDSGSKKNDNLKLYTALAAAGSGAVSGLVAYLVVNHFEKSAIREALSQEGTLDGEVNVEAIKEKYKLRKVWIPIVAGLGGAALGGGAYYFYQKRKKDSDNRRSSKEAAKSIISELEKLEQEGYVQAFLDIGHDRFDSGGGVFCQANIPRVIGKGYADHKKLSSLSGVVVKNIENDFSTALDRYENAFQDIEEKLKNTKKKHGSTKLLKDARRRFKNFKENVENLRSASKNCGDELELKFKGARHRSRPEDLEYCGSESDERSGFRAHARS